jgi:GNAT superfamily N-acetyltransferase
MKAAAPDVEIREFRPGDEAAFRRLNEEWIVHYFAMEPKDEKLLIDPHGAILARGGRIFFAIRDGIPVGCCALLAAEPGEFELAKMAVTESVRGSGVGRELLEKTIAAACASGATRLFLETNHRLSPAIRLYESVGFRHYIPGHPSPYARADTFMEMSLSARAASAVTPSS